MLAVGEGKFLGVTSGKNDRGEFFRLDLYDDQGGGALRLYCNEDSYNKGMVIPWGKVVNVSLSVRSYNGRNYVSVEDISD